MKTVDQLTDVRLLSYACHFLAANLDADNLQDLLRAGEDDLLTEKIFTQLEHRLDDLGDRFCDPVRDDGECHECGRKFDPAEVSNEPCPDDDCPSNCEVGPDQVVVIHKHELAGLLRLLWAELDADEDSRHLFWTREQVERMVDLGEHLKIYAF